MSTIEPEIEAFIVAPENQERRVTYIDVAGTRITFNHGGEIVIAPGEMVRVSIRRGTKAVETPSTPTATSAAWENLWLAVLGVPRAPAFAHLELAVESAVRTEAFAEGRLAGLRESRDAVQERKHGFVSADPDNTDDGTVSWTRGRFSGAQAAEDVIAALLGESKTLCGARWGNTPPCDLPAGPHDRHEYWANGTRFWWRMVPPPGKAT